MGFEGVNCIHPTTFIRFIKRSNLNTSPPLCIFTCSWRIPKCSAVEALQKSVSREVGNSRDCTTHWEQFGEILPNAERAGSGSGIATRPTSSAVDHDVERYWPWEEPRKESEPEQTLAFLWIHLIEKSREDNGWGWYSLVLSWILFAFVCTVCMYPFFIFYFIFLFGWWFWASLKPTGLFLVCSSGKPPPFKGRSQENCGCSTKPQLHSTSTCPRPATHPPI